MRKKVWKFLAYYIIIKLLFLAIYLVVDIPLMKVFKLKSLLEADASFNDLHYQVKKEMKEEAPALSGKIVIINSGSIERDSFRLDLARLLGVLKKYNPKVIGIDHDFRDTVLPGTPELIREIQNNSSIILASQGSNSIDFNKNVRFADVGFPQQITIRRYTTEKSSFAYQIANEINQNNIAELKGKTFFINYVGRHDELISRSDSIAFEFFEPTEGQSAFIMLEARDILRGDTLTVSKLAQVAGDNALLIGHLGNTHLTDVRYDSEDKYRVPYDKIGIEREKTMPGVLIFANAIENILNPSLRFFCISDTLLFKIIKEILMILFLIYLLFFNIGKAINLLILALLTFPALWIVLYLMKHNIYLEIGLTLVQLILLEETVKIIYSVQDLFIKTPH